VGIIHGPDGRMWFVKLASTGAIFTEFRAASGMEELVEWYLDGSLENELDERLVLSFIYAFSEFVVDGNQYNEVSIDPTEDLENIYSNSAYILAHSWQWHPIDPKAAAVFGYAYNIPDGLGRFTKVFSSYTVEVEFTFNEETGNPDGYTIEKGEEVYNRIDYTSHGAFWYRPCVGWLSFFPGFGDPQHTPWYELVDTEDAPFYCFWKKVSENSYELKVFGYNSYNYTNDNLAVFSPPTSCGEDADHIDPISKSITIIDGGFNFHSLPNRMELGSEQYTNTKWSLGSRTGFVNVGFTYLESEKENQLGLFNSLIGECDGAAISWLEGQSGYSYSGWQLDSALVLDASQIMTYISGRDIKQQVFITNDPLVVYSVLRTNTEETRYITDTYTGNGYKKACVAIRAYTATYNGSSYDFSYGEESPVLLKWATGADYGVAGTQRIFSCITLVSNEVETEETDVGNTVTTIETPEDSIVYTENDAYYDWACSDVLPWVDSISCSINALKSYGGALIHVSKPGTDYICTENENIPSVLNVAYDIGWIGGA
jgi:hypothetical protein